MAALIYWSGPVAAFIARNLTGPSRGTPGQERLSAIRDSRGWLLAVRLVIVAWAGGALVAALLAMVGALPGD